MIDFQENCRFTPEDTVQWDTRVLIIKSSDDSGVMVESSESLDRMYPNAETRLFLKEGHLPSITRMDEYLGIVFDFLKQ